MKMKKIGRFFINLFTKNIGIKLLAIALAALTVVFININVAAAQKQNQNEKETYAISYVEKNL